MSDTSVKNFCTWARGELLRQVRQQALYWGIREDGYDPKDADVVAGRGVLSGAEKRQRGLLIDKLGPAAAKGYAGSFERLMEEAAYTWFNRMAAIRFMELNGRVPCRVRILSGEDGSFSPQVLKCALHVQIEGLDADRVVEAMGSGDDEALFRLLFLAQCDELSRCMPDVFEPVGSAMELLLPAGLLHHDGVLAHLVRDIPESDWREGVEIVGWMYQYYVSERKDEVFAGFKKGKKAERDAIAPATQLFTPEWIVRYLVENSLGRLWTQNNPSSQLVSRMPYYIANEDDARVAFRRVSSPEEITVVDPACGSGHILVYAFDLLASIYEEAGYVRRDIPRLVLENNLSGMEIDPRAAAMASFALAMKACEYDSRFLRRGVRPRITCLRRAELDEGELELVPELGKRVALLDAMAHADECGSLFAPDAADLAALDDALHVLDGQAAAGNLFADAARDKVRQMRRNCEPLARTYDIVVANPPYMGGKNMNKWLSAWVKKSYPDVKGDLFSCFISRNLAFGVDGSQLGFMTPYVWMFIGTYEKLRHKIIEEASITSLVQLEYSGFAGATVPICTFTLRKGCTDDYEGGYVRLSDFPGAENQAPRALEAIANPDCGWFYRRSANSFSKIPGTPIAYWASEAIELAYSGMDPIEKTSRPHIGMMTGDNDRFIRFWWEVSNLRTLLHCVSTEMSRESFEKWYPCNKGGEFRKWYGNQDYVVDWQFDGKTIVEDAKRESRKYMDLPSKYKFKPSVAWSMLSSSRIAFRYFPAGFIFEHASSGMIGRTKDLMGILGFCNSEVAYRFTSLVSPTLNFNVNSIASLPMRLDGGDVIASMAQSNVGISKLDYDSFETSWDFKRHPMV